MVLVKIVPPLLISLLFLSAFSVFLTTEPKTVTWVISETVRQPVPIACTDSAYTGVGFNLFCPNYGSSRGLFSQSPASRVLFTAAASSGGRRR